MGQRDAQAVLTVLQRQLTQPHGIHDRGRRPERPYDREHVHVQPLLCRLFRGPNGQICRVPGPEPLPTGDEVKHLLERNSEQQSADDGPEVVHRIAPESDAG